MISKATLHQLIDDLPDTKVERAWALLEPLRAETDALIRALDEAPEDDEPITAADLAAIAEADADIASGNVAPWDEVKARLFGEP